MTNKKVSIVIPCFNESKYIQEMLQGLLNQDYPQNLIEIIVIDGNSSDGTKEILKEIAEVTPSLKILNNPRKTTPISLNMGIKEAQGEIIVRMDCHAIYPKNYLTYLIHNLEKLSADNVGVCVKTIPYDESPVCVGIALALSSPIGVGNSLFRIGIKKTVQADTVPFGCYRKDVFSRIGYFDEELTRNQDDEFNSRLIANGGRIFLLPDFPIRYFARKTLKQLSTMYYQYGLFKPLSNKKSKRIVSTRQLIPPLWVMTLIVLCVATPFMPPAALLLSFVFTIYISSITYFAIKATHDKKAPGKTIFFFILATFSMHFAYGVGFIKGASWLFLKKSLKKIEVSR